MTFILNKFLQQMQAMKTTSLRTPVASTQAFSTLRAYVPDRVWDGVSANAVEDAALLIDGPRIVCVSHTSAVHPEIERIHLPGCTIIPGLIDSHVHYYAHSGPSYLAAGVTYVRDVGNDLDWILQQRDALSVIGSLGPRLVCCGFALDGSNGLWNHVARRHHDAESLRASIREGAARGVDAIKLYAGITPELMRVGVAEAHAQGKFALAHLNETVAEEAIDGGLNEIEHFSRCDVAWRSATPAEDDVLIDRFLKRGAIMNPTLNVWDRLGRALEHSFLRDSRREWVHPELLAIWKTIPYRRCEPAKRLRFQALMPHLKRFLLRCHERGVDLIAGTDTPFINLIPGFGLHDELAQYVDAGIPAVDALRYATSYNARVLGLGERVGRLAPNID
ncbi:MAG: amidohydrolase family protein, partial [Acidobacteria bacterium]|nr:amidohydrolase family protein [Acidobacteriota bacterium]